MKTLHAYPIDHLKRKLGVEGIVPLFSRGQVAWPSKPNVGLTGGSGWLGRHLARRLLSENPELYLVVPIRASSVDRGMGKIMTLWCPTPELSKQAASEHWWDRTQVIQIEDLGEQWSSCGLHRSTQTLDTVIHAAADMSLALSLDQAWAANVASTQNAYQWAQQSGSKRFDHISTLSVFIAGSDTPARILEDTPLEQPRVLHGGYAASKWAAEAWLATQSEMSVAIHRLGLLSLSKTDGWAPGDGLYAAALAWKKWGCPEFAEPRVSEQVDWSPVHKVADGIHQTIKTGQVGAFHWASRLAVPSTVWVRLWKQQFGSNPGVWPMNDPLAKHARRALGRWSNPTRAQTLWWHDVFQSGSYEYDAQYASKIYPQWSWTQRELEDALRRME